MERGSSPPAVHDRARRERFAVIRLAAVAAGAAITVLGVAFAAPSLVRAILSLPVEVFPGGRDAAYYTGQMRRAALGWAAALPMIVLTVGGLLDLWRGSGPLRRLLSGRWVIAAWVFTLSVAFATVPRQLTGDEPTYLAMAKALARHGSLVIGGDPSLHLSFASHAPRAVHDPGIAVLLALPFAVAGRFGMAIALACLTAALLVVVREVLVRHVGEDDALMVVLLAAVSFPVVSYAPLLLPEIAGALGLTVLYRAVAQRRDVGVACAIAVAVLPWLHVRFLPGSIVLAGASVLTARRRSRAVTAVVAPLLASLLLMAWVHLRWFGSPSPFAAWGGRHGLLSLSNALPGVFGLAFDQQYGLLVWAPLFLLAPLGLVELWRRARGETVLLVGVVAVTVGPGILHEWWGGWSPAARFLVPVAGQLLLLAGLGAQRVLRALAPDRLILGILLALQVAIGALCVLVPGKVYGTMSTAPRNYYLDLAGRVLHLDPAWLFPSLRVSAGAGTLAHATLLTAIWLGLCVLWHRRLARLESGSRGGRLV